MFTLEEQVQLLKDNVKEYPDFPKPGVLFRDMFSIFLKPKLHKVLENVLIAYVKKIEPPVDCVAGLDARGFLLGPLIASELQIPFIPIRKKGKLPGETVTASYGKEYGPDTLEMQKDSIQKGQRVLLVDDLLATGGSLGAGCELVEKLGGKLAGCLVLMELVDLRGREKVPTEVTAIIQY